MECEAKQGYTGALKPAIVEVGTPWYMYVLYVILAVAVIAGVVKAWPLLATKIPKGSYKGNGAGGGLGDTSARMIQQRHTHRYRGSSFSFAKQHTNVQTISLRSCTGVRELHIRLSRRIQPPHHLFV
jgi:hypothetical protein